jgi:hypothetical protein
MRYAVKMHRKVVACGLESAVSRWLPMERCCKHDNKSSLKGGEFLDHLNDCELHKEDCIP